MKALVLHAPKDLRIEERDVPRAGPGEVLIRIARGGICGSDLHYFSHGGWGTVRIREPMILGHEVAGHIEALGDGVTGLSVGQLVAVSPSRPCGTCTFCRAGRASACLNMRVYGSAMPFRHIGGAVRQWIVADPRQCAPADGLDPGVAAMGEPLAVCLHAARRAGELLGKRVLVTGCGPIGLLTILAARRAGAREIVATDLTGFALSMARRVGADRTIDMSAAPDGLAEYEPDKGTFDVMFECTGAPSALSAGVAAMRPGGIVVQIGLGGDMPLPMQVLTTKELDLRGSFRFHEEFHVGVELMRKGLIDVSPLITHTVSVDDALDGFALAADRSQAMKTQIAF